MKLRLLLAPLAALLAAAPAPAATQNLNIARAADRDCTSLASPRAAGVSHSSFTAPAQGTLNARLLGRARAGDWDLVAFDSAGSMIAGSSAFRANEVVQVHLLRGARVTLQACRVSGRGRSVPLHTSFAKVDFAALEQRGAESLVEVPIQGPATVHALEQLGLDVTHDVHDGHARVMLYGDRDRDVLARTGLGFEVIHNDVPAVERALIAADRRRAKRMGGVSPLPSGRTEYRTLEDVQKELKDMVAQYPDLVRPFTLKTKTFEGRDIEVVEVATDVASEDDTRPVVFLNGIHHAREWPATEVIIEFVWDLLKNHNSDPQLARILKDVRVVMNPYTNVDGFVVSRAALGQPDPDSDAGIVYSTVTGVVILGGSFGYKRKNCNPYPVVAVPGGPCEVNFGTDNNRNYAHQWGGVGASTNPNDQSYRGPGPSSEPETKAIQELHLSLNAPVLLSMHNIAAKVLRPPGTEAEGFSPDEPALKELGRRMADPTGYLNQYGWELYDVTGGTKDWAYAATSSFGYTVETGPANGDFHGSYQSVVIDQYLGKGELAGRGMREALIAASLWTREEQHTSRIAGRAPAGRTLRITKPIKTLTSPVCAVAGVLLISTTQTSPDECIGPGEVMEYDEKLDISTKVPANGNFTWWLNPSTRPYSKSPESYHLTCADGDKVLQETDVVVARGQTLNIDLPCGGTLPPLVGTGGGGGGTGGGTGATLPAIGVLTVISAAVDSGKRATARKRGVRVRVACTVQCKATATISLTKKVARQLRLGRKALKVGTGRAAITKSGRIPFFVKLTPKLRKALTRKKVRKFALAVRIVVTDNAGGQAKTFNKRITLR